MKSNDSNRNHQTSKNDGSKSAADSAKNESGNGAKKNNETSTSKDASSGKSQPDRASDNKR